MNSDPAAAEILAAVADWLEAHAKTLSGRDAYFARVAVNALGIVRRELSPAADAERDRAEIDLCAALRDGTIDETTPGLIDDLKAAARRQIEIDQPNYRAAPLVPR